MLQNAIYFGWGKEERKKNKIEHVSPKKTDTIQREKKKQEERKFKSIPIGMLRES